MEIGWFHKWRKWRSTAKLLLTRTIYYYIFNLYWAEAKRNWSIHLEIEIKAIVALFSSDLTDKPIWIVKSMNFFLNFIKNIVTLTSLHFPIVPASRIPLTFFAWSLKRSVVICDIRLVAVVVLVFVQSIALLPAFRVLLLPISCPLALTDLVPNWIHIQISTN